jgi:hypothetical protein
MGWAIFIWGRRNICPFGRGFIHYIKFPDGYWFWCDGVVPLMAGSSLAFLLAATLTTGVGALLIWAFYAKPSSPKTGGEKA